MQGNNLLEGESSGVGLASLALRRQNYDLS
jgi:hypothetical protein